MYYSCPCATHSQYLSSLFNHHNRSHIKGLVINFIHHFWPSLMDRPGFLRQFITPIVKATKGKRSKTFFTLPEVKQWMQTDESKGYNFKYYKGLGTSTSEEAKEYFANLDTHEVFFETLSKDKLVLKAPPKDEIQVEDDDIVDTDEIVPDKHTSGSDLIDMVFRKDRVEDRKTWLNNLKEETFLDYGSLKDQGVGVKYSDFINREFILFSRSDNMRSIPHYVDGFKPSQRKVLFACFKKNLKKEIKVAQLAGYVGEKSSYHHGEASLHGTITNMAQNFVGSNNLNVRSCTAVKVSLKEQFLIHCALLFLLPFYRSFCLQTVRSRCLFCLELLTSKLPCAHLFDTNLPRWQVNSVLEGWVERMQPALVTSSQRLVSPRNSLACIGTRMNLTHIAHNFSPCLSPLTARAYHTMHLSSRRHGFVELLG
jgi:DNA gyrase/topoisomerase IV, subunit A/C-terminal associated domain of TOPRIM